MTIFLCGFVISSGIYLFNTIYDRFQNVNLVYDFGWLYLYPQDVLIWLDIFVPARVLIIS